MPALASGQCGSSAISARGRIRETVQERSRRISARAASLTASRARLGAVVLIEDLERATAMVVADVADSPAMQTEASRFEIELGVLRAPAGVVA